MNGNRSDVSHKKCKKQKISHKKMTNTNYANYLALLANAHAQAKSLLRSLEQEADFRFHVNADHTDFMCFK